MVLIQLFLGVALTLKIKGTAPTVRMARLVDCGHSPMQFRRLARHLLRRDRESADRHTDWRAKPRGTRKLQLSAGVAANPRTSAEHRQVVSANWTARGKQATLWRT